MHPEELIEKIRQAFSATATADTRHQGAEACRLLLMALGTPPGQPFQEGAPQASPPPSPPSVGGATALDPVGAFLDAVIAKYSDRIPPGRRAPVLSIPFVDLSLLR